MITVVDAGILIAALDSADAHHGAATAALTGFHPAQAAVPASVLAEIMVRPHRHGTAAVRKVDAFLDALAARIIPLDQKVAREAARLRAKHDRLRLPDALVLATALSLDAPLLTTDTRIPRTTGVHVEVVGRGA